MATPSNSVSAAGKLKTIYVGKNQYPISIIQLAEFLEIAWKKKAGFGLKNSSVGSLSGGHSASDLITPVENEVPVDTYYGIARCRKTNN